MNNYWKSEDLDDKEFIAYHEFDEDGYELKKIVFRDNQVLWASDTHYHGEDIYTIDIPTPKEDLENIDEETDRLKLTQLSKKEFYTLWNKIIREYPGEKY